LRESGECDKLYIGPVGMSECHACTWNDPRRPTDSPQTRDIGNVRCMVPSRRTGNGAKSELRPWSPGGDDDKIQACLGLSAGEISVWRPAPLVEQVLAETELTANEIQSRLGEWGRVQHQWTSRVDGLTNHPGSKCFDFGVFRAGLAEE